MSSFTRRPVKSRLDTLETQTKRLTADVAFTSSTTLANLGELFADVVPGVYKVNIALQTTANASGGAKTAFKFNNSATLTSIQVTAKTYAAAAVAVARAVTETDQASLSASTSAALAVEIEGTLVVATGGRLNLQGAQNASNGSATTFLIGSTLTLTRIG